MCAVKSLIIVIIICWGWSVRRRRRCRKQRRWLSEDACCHFFDMFVLLSPPSFPLPLATTHLCPSGTPSHTHAPNASTPVVINCSINLFRNWFGCANFRSGQNFGPLPPPPHSSQPPDKGTRQLAGKVVANRPSQSEGYRKFSLSSIGFI